MVAWVLSGPTLALDRFLQEKERGWFWYETQPEPEPEPEPPPPPKPQPTPQPQQAATPPPAAPTPLSVEWFRQEYRKVLDRAIDQPTPDNVAQYRYLTRVMLDKASNFAHEFKRQALLDPLLDESNRYPFSQAARGSYMRFTFDQRAEAIRALTQRVGLWVFMDARCVFCKLQYPIINRLSREWGFVTFYITPDGQRPEWMDPQDEVRRDQGQSRVLRIQVRPAVALIVPPNTIQVLSQGMMSQDLLEERILYAADRAQLFTPELRKTLFPMEYGILTTADIQEAGRRMQQDPQQTVSTLQQLLERRY